MCMRERLQEVVQLILVENRTLLSIKKQLGG